MKRLIVIILISVLMSGCAEKVTEKKYVSGSDKEKYITLSSDGTAFYHTGGVENRKGTWDERDSEINVYLADGSSLIFIKLKYAAIGLKLNNGDIARYYEK